MPPFPRDSASNEFSDQWIHPGDVFSVLLILGGDVISRALAQLTGGFLTPVAFSFGWVAYSVSALVSTVGENKLMPLDPDCKAKIINGRNGFTRENSSWILGRIVRDFGNWSKAATKNKTADVLNERWQELQKEDPKAAKPTIAGLVVTVYQPSKTQPAGVPQSDFVYWSGIVTAVVQLGVAAIPCGLFGDWGILMITACGIALAFTTGALRQWKKEKWACRPNAKDPYILTRGNGTQHAIAILGNKYGLNLEDLAAGQSNVDVSTNTFTRAAVLGLSIFWVLLLITAAGLKTNTWFLLAVGGIGIAQNIFVAGWQRRPENFGIHLDFMNVFGHTKVMNTLFEVEEDYPRLGRSMRDEFFPGKLRVHEMQRWEQLEEKADRIDAEKKEKEKRDKEERERQAREGQENKKVA
ncbi:hypothetical protein V8E54_012707 [Elaphomyces granulatus]|jgi:hypothetical protein